MDSIARSTQDLAYDIGEATETHWSPPANMTFDEWTKVGNTLQQLNRSVGFWLGDWMLTGESKWGDTYTQAVNATDASIETLKKYLAVAKRVEPAIRDANLTWTHHFYVAYIPQEHRGPMLSIAAMYGLSTREFQAVSQGLPDEQRQRMIDAYIAVPDEHLPMALPWDQLLSFATTEPEQESTQKIVEEPKEDTVEVDGTEYKYKTDEGEPVLEHWESLGTPLLHATESYAEWPGISVMAIVDEEGNGRLLWNLGVENG